MTPDVLRLLAQIAVAAAWGLCHLRLVLRTTTTKRRLAPGVRWLVLLPPMAPIAAFMAGQRLFPVVWFALAATYVALRMPT